MLRPSLYAAAALTIAAASFFGAYRYTHTSASTNTITPYDADVDGNGAVTIADPIAALNQIGAMATGARPVAEQNLDANGNIKVHEQGTVNVNVAATPSSDRVIPVLQNQLVPSGTPFASPLVDIHGCRNLTIFLQPATTGGNGVRLTDVLSVDGQSVWPGTTFNGGNYPADSGVNVTSNRYLTVDLTAGANQGRAPYIGLVLTDGDPTDRTISAWLYCTEP